MLNDNCYVYKKEVDWSVLHQGVSIPVMIQIVFQNTINKFLTRGQSKDIYLLLEEKTYKVRLVNQKFNEKKYPNRKDILQIRYHPQSEIAEKLRTIFAASYKYILEQRNSLPENQRKFIKIPEEQKECLAIYTTEYPDTYLLECITVEDTRIVKDIIVHEDEQKYEESINYNTVDPTATIAAMNQTIKIRKLNRAIGESLKLLYHHRIIHKARPIFNRRKLIFVYNNGAEERILLNQHL